ncbi:MAG: Hsp20/alpha crystallin family protein, partial [Chthoniobacterales bacterium]
MSLIRYQTPDLSPWRSLDRWSNLRDEINSLFELPGWSMTPQAQLFNGWTPALDLYQTNDDIVAVVELPGMRKEEIEIS